MNFPVNRSIIDFVRLQAWELPGLDPLTHAQSSAEIAIGIELIPKFRANRLDFFADMNILQFKILCLIIQMKFLPENLLPVTIKIKRQTIRFRIV